MRKIQNLTLRKFASKKILVALLLSMLINWATVYYSYEGTAAMHLFTGKYSVARFLIPMSFLLPFLVSFGILKKSVKLASEKEEKEHAFPKKSYLLKCALINASFTFIPVGLGLLGLYLFMPGDPGIERAHCAICLGLFAGMLATFFVYRSILKIDRLLR